MRGIIFFPIIQQLLYLTSRVESLTGQNVTAIRRGDFQFIASFRHFPKGDNFCGGALISKKYVITAEHCLEDETPESFRIVFEIAIGHEAVVEHIVYSWTTFVDWSTRYGLRYDNFVSHDVAIVKLANKVYEIKPVPLNKLDKRQLDNQWAIMIGWKNNVLHKASVNILNDEHCDRRMHVLNDEIDIDDRTLCSIANPVALLDEGDSGAPLLSPVDNTLLGIAFGLTPDDINVHGNLPNAIVQRHQVNLHFGVHYYGLFIRGAAWL